MSPAPNAADTQFKLNENARFGFHGENLIVEDLEQGIELELPNQALGILKRFRRWTPVAQAFHEPNDTDARVLAIVRQLIMSRILVSKEDEDHRESPHDGWSSWGPALMYHLASRTRVYENSLRREDWSAQLFEKAKAEPAPGSFKDYPDRPFFPLDKVDRASKIGRSSDSLPDVLINRRTCRSYSAVPITKKELSTLLHYTWGYHGTWENKLGHEPLLKKTSPSGGALHSVEVYPIVLNVKGVPKGVYHYSVRYHGLELLDKEDPAIWLSKACADQRWIQACATVFVMSSVLYRFAWKYADPLSFRVMLFEIGHFSQTLLLMASWLGLGSFVNDALRDEVFEQKLGLDYREEPVFLIDGVGNPLERL